MIVNVSNSQKTIKISKNQVKILVQEVIFHEGQTCEEVSVHFVSKFRIGKLHRDFFDDPTPTDCISFPMDEDIESPHRVLGEIFVCPEVAKEYSIKHNIDQHEEITLYIIHGLLHLMGYNDIQIEERKLMRKAEKRHMVHLKQLNLHLTSC